jgi:hypothetical protein
MLTLPIGFAPAAVIMPGLEQRGLIFPHLEDSGEPRHCSERSALKSAGRLTAQRLMLGAHLLANRRKFDGVIT